MSKLQFRVLYRQFLFRIVDLELLSPEGDTSRLLGQFASLLIFVGMLFSATAMGIGNSNMPRADLLISAWSAEHLMIATTMLVVGLFAVLSWDSTFPDRTDVLVLAPLPIRASTLFLAKVAASGTALGITVLTFNALAGLALPLALAPPSSTVQDLILSPDRYRLFAAYWITVFSAGAFIYCSVLGLQGLAVQILPRGQFLRISALLQMAAFCLFVTVYFLQPSLTTPRALSAPENQPLLAWLPSYWFLGLFQELNGSAHPALAPLARRAWTAMLIVGCCTAVTYALSYLRTLRKILEEPDIVPTSGGLHWLPVFGNSLGTAIVQFSIRTLLRSRQHRVMLAFYLGIGFAIVLMFMRTPRGQQDLFEYDRRLLFSSLMIMCVWIIGTRVIFSMPLALRANWIFRITEIRGARAYLAVIRRPLFVLAVAPVWLGSAIVLLWNWPWLPAAGHLLILGLWGNILAYVSLQGFQKIPFTCSYLPGKSFVHMAFLAALGLLFVIAKVAAFEQSALENPVRYAKMLSVFGVLAVAAMWRTIALAKSGEAFVQFEDIRAPAILGLGLQRDGVLPDEALK